MKKGFTLIEILVSIVIFGILALAANQILFSTLRGTGKSEVVSRVKNEGNYAFSVMERLLHSSRGIVSCGSDTVAYLDADGLQTSFSCIGGADSRVASGSARLTSTQISVDPCSLTCEPMINPRAILVNMTLSARGTSGLRPEEQARVQLQTRILLRN